MMAKRDTYAPSSGKMLQADDSILDVAELLATSKEMLAAIEDLLETGAAKMQINGSKVAEQLTEADAVANVLTFAAPISAVEIFHDADTRQTFVVNGISIIVPPGYYRTPVDGVASAEVTIPAGITCIVGRLV
jgi:hypothetical protein